MKRIFGFSLIAVGVALFSLCVYLVINYATVTPRLEHVISPREWPEIKQKILNGEILTGVLVICSIMISLKGYKLSKATFH